MPEQSANPEDAARRLVDAEAMLDVASTLLDIDDRYASAGVAAALAELAGLAAADAACAAALGVVAPVADAAATTELLRKVEPHGSAMAADLNRLNDQKGDAREMTGAARDMVATCRQVLAGTDSPIG